MFKVRTLRRSPYIYIFAKLAFAIAVSYVIAYVSLSILHKLNELSAGEGEESALARLMHEASDERRRLGKPFATILFWTRWFDEKAPIHDFSIKRCMPATCHITTDRTALKHADAVIFHSRDLDLHDLPNYRSPSQIWIFLTLESPFFSGIQIPIWRNISSYPGGLFNWTATYRRDSDIYCPYGAVRRVSVDDSLAKRDPFFENGIKNKTSRILWFAGNCHTMSNRELFVERLKKLYPIDIYGPCGEQTLDDGDDEAGDETDGEIDVKATTKKSAARKITTTLMAVKKDEGSGFEKQFKQCNTRKREMECWRTLAQRYKYYLALENSFCRDYITEKFYRPLYYGLLPIVAGGHGTEDYSAIAPPKSFISAFDYNSAKDIAALLQKLDRNVTLYNSYFAWRKTHTVEFRNPLCVCEICRRLIKELKWTHAQKTMGQSALFHQSLRDRIKANKALMKNPMLDDDDDFDDGEEGLIVVRPTPGSGVGSTSRDGDDNKAVAKPPAGDVSRWWHDGACVVP